MQIDYPFRIDGRGRVAGTTYEDHIRDMVEQILFTAPGERVNRPTFGSGLMNLVFEPNGTLLAGATEATVGAALQQWLGELIRVDGVSVENQESALYVTIAYTVRRTNESRVEKFAKEI